MCVTPGEVFGPIGVLNRFTELRHLKVKHNFVFHMVSWPPSPSSLLKLPKTTTVTKTSLNKRLNEKNKGPSPLPLSLFIVSRPIPTWYFGQTPNTENFF